MRSQSVPLRSVSFMPKTQSGRGYCASGSMPTESPSLESLITMSLPLWLLVSSEYPSSNLFALMEDAGRKACMYGGGANGSGLLFIDPAMMLESWRVCGEAGRMGKSRSLQASDEY